MVNSITEYFLDEMKTETWVENPFVKSLNLNKLTRKEREQLIDIATDSTLKVKFQEELARFWIGLSTEYPDITANALKVIMRFRTTYLCERTFSLYAATKTKFRK